jgi:hypothetical protein
MIEILLNDANDENTNAIDYRERLIETLERRERLSELRLNCCVSALSILIHTYAYTGQLHRSGGTKPEQHALESVLFFVLFWLGHRQGFPSK